MIYITFVLFCLLAVFAFLAYSYWKKWTNSDGENDNLNRRITILKRDLETMRKLVVPENEAKIAWQRFEEEKIKYEEEIKRLADEFGKSKVNIDLMELGFVRRTFTYEDARSYQNAINEIEEKQANMLRAGTAAKCSMSWTVEGSQKKGEVMMKKLIKLAVRTFNADADAAISRVKWNNFKSMKERILKSEETIEKTMDQWGIVIDDEYRNLKIKELELTFEQAEVMQRAREEQRALKEQQREEEKARREAEKAKLDAEAEERKLQDALAKAKAEMENSRTQDMSKYLMKIKELEIKLSQVGEEKLRAVSMAQLTRMGYVYIISNIGSFGEHVYKIGMTRRLDPMDRVWELSDASVPFDFDVHGIIKCDDAPALESKLHEKFLKIV